MKDTSTYIAERENGRAVGVIATAQVEMTLTGLSALLMHSTAGADPLNPLTRERDQIAKKVGDRSVVLAERLLELDWRLALYADEAGPFLPATNIKASITAGGRLVNKGAGIERGVIFHADRFAVQFDGPRDVDELWADPRFRDTRLVKNAGRTGGRVLRCRPCFREWQITAGATLQLESCDLDVLGAAGVRAGQLVGVGDYRPKSGGPGVGGEFGRYDFAVRVVA